MHLSSITLTEVIPNQKMVWHVDDNYFNFLKDKKEWTGTNIVFDNSPKGNQKKLRFTHEGLNPAVECYDVCNDAWTNYIQKACAI